MFTDGFTFLLKGGPVMWPLFACALISLTIIIERYFALRKVLRGSREMTREVQAALRGGRARPAFQALQTRGGPIAHVMATAIDNIGLERAELESMIAEVAMEETPAITRGLGALDTIITISPLLGLLGTVTGMIRAFQVVGMSSGRTAPAAITGGVAEALIATATGLAIAIVTLVGYNFLSDQVKAIVAQMEVAATKVINSSVGNRAPRNGADTTGAQEQPLYATVAH